MKWFAVYGGQWVVLYKFTVCLKVFRALQVSKSVKYCIPLQILRGFVIFLFRDIIPQKFENKIYCII